MFDNNQLLIGFIRTLKELKQDGDYVTVPTIEQIGIKSSELRDIRYPVVIEEIFPLSYEDRESYVIVREFHTDNNGFDTLNESSKDLLWKLRSELLGQVGEELPDVSVLELIRYIYFEFSTLSSDRPTIGELLFHKEYLEKYNLHSRISSDYLDCAQDMLDIAGAKESEVLSDATCSVIEKFVHYLSIADDDSKLETALSSVDPILLDSILLSVVYGTMRIQVDSSTLEDAASAFEKLEGKVNPDTYEMFKKLSEMISNAKTKDTGLGAVIG